MIVAIFGGSFDPPHIGHEEIIKKALQNLDIDRLFIVPTYLNPFKEKFFAPPDLRLKWIKKLIKCYKNTQIITYEINKQRSVPTIETIKYISYLYDLDKIYLIIGADNLKNLHKWKEFDELKKLVHFVIASRNDIDIPKNLQKLQIDVNISSTLLRVDPKRKYLPKTIADEVIEYYKKRKEIEAEKRLEKIISYLDEKKAENIQLFDMKDKDYIVDNVIIATTLNPKHGLSLVDHLKKELKKMGENILEIEESDEWSVIDLGDTLIHLMSPEYRAKYNIEEFLSNRDKRESY